MINWYCPPCCPKTIFSQHLVTASVWQFCAQLFAWIESKLKGIFLIWWHCKIWSNLFFWPKWKCDKVGTKNLTFEFWINQYWNQLSIVIGQKIVNRYRFMPDNQTIRATIQKVDVYLVRASNNRITNLGETRVVPLDS